MSSKLRIAIVAACPFPLARGTPVRIVRMAEALAQRGHDVHVATYHLGEGTIDDAVKVHRIPNVRFYRKLSPGPSYQKLLFIDPLLVMRLRRLLKQIPFDVIHAHHYEGVLVGAAARVKRTPLVYDAHTLLLSELPFYSMGLPHAVKKRLGRWMDGRIPRLADHTVCVTETIRDKLDREAKIDPGMLSVITNGIEVEHFDPAKSVPSLPRDGRTITYTGNLASYQRIDLLLKAFAQVHARVADSRLVIAADSSFDPYEALARELGIRQHIQIVTSPKFAELPGLLASTDVAVNPRTDGDGVPVKMLNYMAAGRPVVAFDSNAPGIVHGRNGWLAPSGDIAALANGIVTLLAHPQQAQEIGLAGREYVMNNCRWPIVAERCEQLYRSLIERRA